MGAGWVFDAEHKKLVASVTSLTTSCRVLTEKMQAQSLVPQGFAGF